METRNNSDLLRMKQLIASLQEGAVKENEETYTDHEVSMAASQLLSSVKSANRIAKHITGLSESEGLEAWVASKLTLAEEYLQTVADHMDGEKLHEGYKVMPPMDKKYQPRPGLEGPFTTLSGKVVYYDPKEGKYYDSDTDMYMTYDEFQKHDTDYSGMKEEQIDEAYQIDWPDKDEDGDSEMERHAYNAIRHDMNAYDAYDHVYSMSRERDWLTANKDDIIKMFAKYGLQTEGLEEEYYESTEGSNAMNTLRKIVADKQNMPVKFDDGQMKVDLFSANAITQVYDAVKPETREKIDKLLKTKAGMMKVQAFSMKQFESVNEATDTCECGCDCGKDVCETCGKKHCMNEASEMMTEAQFDEAAGEKDACYHKVKSRYKVWPSAYASGALVKCRKVGAKNWGNSKK